MAEEDALAMDCPEAADPVGIYGSVEREAEIEGGVAGTEEKYVGFCRSADSSKGWVS